MLAQDDRPISRFWLAFLLVAALALRLGWERGRPVWGLHPEWGLERPVWVLRPESELVHPVQELPLRTEAAL